MRTSRTYQRVILDGAVVVLLALAVPGRAADRAAKPSADESEITTAAAAQRPEASDPANESPEQKSIKEAAVHYIYAVENDANGKDEQARRHYRKMLEKMGCLDAVAFKQVQPEFERVLSTLSKRYDVEGFASASRGQIPPVPLDEENVLVRKYLRSFTRGDPKRCMVKAFERSGRYRKMIVGILKEYGLPEELVYLPVVESLYSINDVSHMGAVGLWQIMPERARYLGLKVNYWVDERRDPEKSTRAACRYLKELYTMFDDWYLALAAYNRGEFGLMRDMRSSNATDLEEMGKRKAMPRETELYVPQFLACVLIGNDPAAYGFSKVAFEPPLAYDKVTVHRAIDLRIVAQCAGTTVREILDLNPSIKSWCTPHNYPGFELCLPAGTRKKFMDNLVRVRELNPQMGYITYQVCKGEDMDVVARKFDTTADAILQDNGLTRDKTLAENQVLLVRPGKNYSGDTGN